MRKEPHVTRERALSKKRPRNALAALRIRGCLLVRRSSKQGSGAVGVEAGLELLERWQALNAEYPNADHRVQDKVFAFESLAEGYSHMEPPETEKALDIQENHYF